MNEGAEKNLLLALYSYASRQSENFATAAFVHLLRNLFTDEPQVATTVIKNLTKGWIELTATDCGQVQIASQKRTTVGQPDIVIAAPATNRNAVVEVKLEAEAHPGQLAYASGLNTRLIFLTRYPLEPKGPSEVRWYEMADWLRHAREAVKRETSKYLLNQFVDFLAGMGVTMERVDEALFAGVRSLQNLMSMLREAVAGLGCAIRQQRGGMEAIGIFFWRNQKEKNEDRKKKYWLGLFFGQPTRLIFATDFQGNLSVDSAAAARDGFTPFYMEWRSELDLGANEGFLAVPKEGQIKAIEQFLDEKLKASDEFTTPIAGESKHSA